MKITDNHVALLFVLGLLGSLIGTEAYRGWKVNQDRIAPVTLSDAALPRELPAWAKQETQTLRIALEVSASGLAGLWLNIRRIDGQYVAELEVQHALPRAPGLVISRTSRPATPEEIRLWQNNFI